MSTFSLIHSVAIIGASEDPSKIGNILLRKNQNFGGKIFAINPKGGEAYGFHFYKNLQEIGEIPDIAVFAIPEKLIYPSLEEAGKLWINRAIIITAGFKEIGNIEGENQLKSIAQQYNIELLGPNCLGYGNTHKNLDLSFGGNFFEKWNIGIISQSGAMAVAITDILASRKLGFSTFFSLGNKAQMDELDALEELANDNNTQVIGIYLEWIARGEKFLKLLKETTKTKPVIIMMGGMSESGKQATASHTGSLSGDKQIYESGLTDAGAIMTYSLKEFFNALHIHSLSTHQNLVGKPIIITNAGGPGVLSTDQAEFQNVTLLPIEPQIAEILREKMPSMMSTKNPIDIIWDANSTRVADILENIKKSYTQADILFLFTIQATTDIDIIAEKIIAFKNNNPQYFINVCLIGWDTIMNAKNILWQAGIFTTQSTEEMISSYKSLLTTRKISFEKNKNNQSSHSRASTLFDISDVQNIFAKFGINNTNLHKCKNLQEAKEYQKNHSDDTLVMKVYGNHIIHKTDMNGVHIGLKNETDIENAYNAIQAGAQKYFNNNDIYEITLEKMITKKSPNIELFFGAKRDENFGNIFVIGAGGIFLDIFADSVLKVGEFEKSEVKKFLQKLRIYPILNWFRGQKGIDFESLETMIVALCKLFTEHTEISEIDINPILFENEKAIIVDAKLYK